MRNSLLFVSCHHLIALSDGEKKNEERKEGKKVKENK